jgi:pectin methylesterase-like acyl-CoA thioesterase
MKKIILFAFLLFSGLLFSQTTYYVSTTGSNSASGTSSNPFLTIQYAIDASVNGDSVIVLPGVYSGGIIYNGKNITISSLYSSTQDELTPCEA